MRRLVTGMVLLGLLCGTAAAQSADETPQALRSKIADLKPAAHAWRKIDWLNCPLDALRKARAEHKPVIVWVFLGNPSDERC